MDLENHMSESSAQTKLMKCGNREEVPLHPPLASYGHPVQVVHSSTVDGKDPCRVNYFRWSMHLPCMVRVPAEWAMHPPCMVEVLAE